MLECINKQFKLEDPDNEVVKTEMEEYYASVIGDLIKDTADGLGKDLFEYKVDGEVDQPSNLDNMGSL